MILPVRLYNTITCVSLDLRVDGPLCTLVLPDIFIHFSTGSIDRSRRLYRALCTCCDYLALPPPWGAIIMVGTKMVWSTIVVD
jgi:hypothetical protein